MNILKEQFAILAVGLTLSSLAMSQNVANQKPMRSLMSCQLILAYADQPISISSLKKKSITVPVSMDPDVEIDSSIKMDDKFSENSDKVIYSYFEASSSLKGMFSLNVSYRSKNDFESMNNVTYIDHFVMPLLTPTLSAGIAHYDLVPSADRLGVPYYLKINNAILPLLIKNGYVGPSTLDKGYDISLKHLNAAIQKALSKNEIKKTDLVLLGTQDECVLRTE